MGREIKPVLAGIQVSQMGGDVLRIRFRGFDLPIPRAASAPGEARLVLQWDGVRFPQTTDKGDWWTDYDWDVYSVDGPLTNSWWKQYDLPLLNRVNAEPVDEDSVWLVFTSSQPMVIDRIDGVGGSDEIIVLLKKYEPEKAAEAPEPPRVYAQGDPMAIKTPVSLAINGADARSAFEMLARLQGLNFFMHPNVPEGVTLEFHFDKVPFNEIFDYMLRACELSYELKGKTIIIGPPASIGTMLGTEVTRSYRLVYSIDEAGQLRGDLTAALTSLVDLSKTPVLDGRNRELYVTATEAQHKLVKEILEKLDKPGRQIMLEARIFEVTDGGRQELQTLVTGIYDHWIASFTAAGLSTGYNYYNGNFDDWDGWTLPRGGTYGTSPPVLEEFPQEAAKALSYGLQALETKGKGRNIANPSVITIDGQEANIELKTEVSYVSGSDSNGNPNISTQNYGPELTFLPIIGRDGVVTIKIRIESGAVVQWRRAGNGAETPEIAKRTVETTVRIRNGEPFVVGGLYQDVKTSERNRIPVLGYIPLLGDLFTIRQDRHDKTEVAMIVIPYILDVPEDKIETSDLRKLSDLR
jgi:type IV pilus assembly protein PilQ